MTPRLLEFYEKELQFIREMGFEFSKRYPKIAANLDLGSTECSDPYVERLLEGFAFLTARIQLKMDAEFPRFSQHLLEIVYPHYLAPLPSMMIVQIQPDHKGGITEEGFVLQRGTKLFSRASGGGRSRCEFKTAHEVRAWPIQVKEATYLPLGQVPVFNGLDIRNFKAGIRIRLQTTSNYHFNQLAINQLTFFLHGTGNVPVQLYELIMGHGVSVVIRNPANQQSYLLNKSVIQSVGYGQNESLLPSTAQTFQGYRLLQEYFALPERFLFFQLNDLNSAISHGDVDTIEILILLNAAQDRLEHVVNADNFRLNCTPAVNLFEKYADYIHLKQQHTEHHLVVDKTKPNDFEVFSILEVIGHGNDQQSKQVFRPFYSDYQQVHETVGNFAYYTIKRQPTLASISTNSNAIRADYVGNEIFLSLVDSGELPFDTDIKHLGVRALCTNRDLPKLLVLNNDDDQPDFTYDVSAPIHGIRCLVGPTNPKPSSAEGSSAWRLINHLSLNYLSLVNNDHQQGAEVLRDLLSLYADFSEHAVTKQIEGLQSVQSRPITCRVPMKGPITFGRGLEITITFDETAFAGGSCFLLGAVLEQFFCKYASINSFTQVKITTKERGEIMQWPVRTGTRTLL
jgi:type VI secretion system protein ImpG